MMLKGREREAEVERKMWWGIGEDLERKEKELGVVT